jgi:prophage maintenance system killer protein
MSQPRVPERRVGIESIRFRGEQFGDYEISRTCPDGRPRAFFGRSFLALSAPRRVSGAARLSPRSLIRPSLELAIAVNSAIREHDEWFDDPDDLDRIQRTLATTESIDEPIHLAAAICFRVARAQAFGEGNKRTALLLGRWVFDRNGIDGARVLAADDRVVAGLLVRAAAGEDTELQMVDLFRERARTDRGTID